MKLEILDEDSYKIFINDDYIKQIDINNKEDLSNNIKSIIVKIKKVYDIILEGFYEVHVYPINNIGLILEIKNIDSYLSKSIDLRIIVHNEEEMYIKFSRYELIKKYNNIKYLNNYFYLNANEINKKDKYHLIEFANIIYGDDLLEVKRQWHNLT